MQNFFFKRIAILLICVLPGQLLVAQNKNIVTLKSADSNKDANIQACTKVVLTDNFQFITSTGTSSNKLFHAVVSASIPCDVDYTATSAIPGIDARILDPSKEVGTTQGSINVGPSGAANYTVPIIVPPAAGMVPNLSIVYSSQAGNGSLGWGFNLSGLSAITRIGKSLYYDNVNEPVNFDNNDRFMLDGQHLILKNGSSYSSSPRSYVTEQESFSDITFTDNGNGNSYFTIVQKDGTVMIYGEADESRNFAYPSRNVMTWMLKRATDISGNVLEVFYGHDGSEYYPDRIEYGKNVNYSSAANTIKFVFQHRDDRNASFVGGYTFLHNLILASISTYSENAIAHTYNFHYNKVDVNTHLYEIQEQGSDGKAYNATEFEWFDSTIDDPQVKDDSKFLKLGSISGLLAPLDYDGDGITDFMRTSMSTSLGKQLYKVNADNGVYSTSPLPGQPDGFNPLSSISDRFTLGAVDFDHDGKEDLILQDPNTGDFSITLSSNISSSIKITRPAEGDATYAVGDFNGDGFSDIFVTYADRTYMHTNQIGKGDYLIPSEHRYLYTFNSQGLPNSPQVFEAEFDEGIVVFYTQNHYYKPKIYSIDFDGDGTNEILFIYEKGSVVRKFNSSGNLTNVTGYLSLPNANLDTHIGDFNGDGLTDLLLHSDEGWKAAYSTGTGFITPNAAIYNPSNDGNHEVFIADFNGDGKSDIIDKSAAAGSTSYGTYITTYYSFGINFITKGYFYDASLNMNAHNTSVGDFDGDGYPDLIYKDSFGAANGNVFLIKANSKRNVNKIKKISNGLNVKISLDYHTLTELAQASQANHYSKQDLHDETYPVAYSQLPLSVVSTLNGDDGIEGQTSIEYSYTGAKLHLRGKGFLGFTSMQMSNKTQQIDVINQYALDHTLMQFLPSVSLSKLTSSLNSEFLRTTYEYPAATTYPEYKHFFTYSSKQTTEDFLKHFKVVTEPTINAEGNLSYQKVEYFNKGVSEGTTETNNDYIAYNGPATIKNRLLTSTVKTNRISDGIKQKEYKRTKNFTYYSNGLLHTEADELLTTEYLREPVFQNISEIHVRGNGKDRVTKLKYDTYGRYTVSSTNALNQKTSTIHEPLYGNITSQTDINGLVSYNTYDGFGRLLTNKSPTGIVSTTNRAWTMNAADIYNAKPVYSIERLTPGEASQKTYYDLLGREIRNQISGFSGSLINVDKEYNARGQRKKETEPYFDSGSNNIFSEYTFDDYGRLSTIINPSKVSMSNVYSTTDSKVQTINSSVMPNRVTSQTFDSWGSVINATDELNGVLKYTYASNGNAIKIEAPGATTKITYDDYARKDSLIDPDAGATKYTYTAYGDLATQIDAKGNEYKMTYDDLGRITQKSVVNGEIIDYTYDNRLNGKGMLATVSVNNAYNSTDNNTKTYDYDTKSRTQKMVETIGSSTFQYDYVYDDNNRVQQTTYPSGLILVNDYANGYLARINKTNGTAVKVWECQEMNERLMPLRTLGGNGLTQRYTYKPETGAITEKKVSDDVTKKDKFYQSYTYDDIKGEFHSRTDNLAHLTEVFEYDDLNRLKASTVNGVLQNTINYEASGNIKNKSDVSASDYVYNVTHPHAVDNILNPGSNIPILPQDIQYTSFNKVFNIAEDTYELGFTYGVNHQRTKTILKNNNIVQQTTYYLPDYEKQISTASASVRELTYINSPEGITAIYANNVAKIDTMYYIYTDHIGSYNLITNDKDTLKERRSYDAWGRIRNASTWDYTGTLPKSYFRRGYTGHEYLAQFKLINMNGRVYDPVVGRFLSPDNYVQNTTITQGFNRYSYCLNNPLKYTDPSGDFWHILIGAAIGGFINFEIQYSNGNIHSFADGVAAFGIGAAGGALAAATFGASLPATVGAGVFVSGAVGGGVGYGFGTITTSIGNQVYFHDKPPTGSDFAKGFVFAAATGGLINTLSPYQPTPGLRDANVDPIPSRGSAEIPAASSEIPEPIAIEEPSGIDMNLPKQQGMTRIDGVDGIKYEDATLPNSSAPNLKYDISASEMSDRLTSMGGVKTIYSGSQFKIELNGQTYMFYTRTSTGAAGVDLQSNGKTLYKLLLNGW